MMTQVAQNEKMPGGSRNPRNDFEHVISSFSNAPLYSPLFASRKLLRIFADLSDFCASSGPSPEVPIKKQ